jgi:hypothetical protein
LLIQVDDNEFGAEDVCDALNDEGFARACVTLRIVLDDMK